MIKGYSNKILVPTDFTKVGECAVNHAIEIAKINNDKVVLLHIIEGKKEAKLRGAEAELKLYKMANKASKEEGVAIDYMSRQGNIFKTIGEVTTEIWAKFVVMGTHGVKGMQRLTGSWALKVILGSKAPYIVVQNRPYNKGYNDVILMLDKGSSTKQQMKWVSFLSDYFNSTFHIMTDDGSDLKETKAHLEKNDIKYRLKELEKDGEVGKQVIDYAITQHADLIMMMVDTKRGFPAFSSQPEAVTVMTNKAQIPTMCVNPSGR